MELAKLEKYKTRFKDFKYSIDSLQSYLGNLNKDAKDAHIITPYVLSQNLRIPETDAFFLLSLAEKESLLNKKYQVFTVNNKDFLGDFDDTQSIPTEITDSEGKTIDRDHYYVDVVFQVEK